ncbi:MAG: SprT family zinc-dependent metalloprotease [Pseudomonadota bacterium]
MADVLVLKGSPAIEARVRRNPRTRRLSLRVSSLDGRVTLSLPRSVPLCEAQAFLEDRADWLRSALAAQPEQVCVAPGVTLPVGGQTRPVQEISRGRAQITDHAVFVKARKPAGPQVAALLRRHALDALSDRCAHYGGLVGRIPEKISLRDARSRWGSCTATGRLMFSWRLAMAPVEILDYVAAHEVAHLREMNHGPRFWQLVQEICPDFQTRRAWLHTHGAELHRYRFEEKGP